MGGWWKELTFGRVLVCVQEMTKIDKFKLDAKFCRPHSGISQFFAKTFLIKWNCIDLFTRFTYEENPIISPQQVFDMYSQISSHYNPINMFSKRSYLKENCLKTIGDTLIHIRRLRAKERVIKTDKTRIDFQTAKENDQTNKRSDVYADLDNEIDQTPSEKKSVIFDITDSKDETEFELLTGNNGASESNQFHNGSEGENVDSERPQENGRSAYKNKRNRDEDEDEIDYEGLSLLFDESNEDSIVEVIDEKTLEQEDALPQASGNEDQQKNLDANTVEAFCKYQKTIPKSRRIFTPAYWGVLDLTRESLYDCKHLTEKDINQLSQDFSNKISWKTMPPEKHIREYFDNNCEKNADNIGKLDINIQFMYCSVPIGLKMLDKSFVFVYEGTNRKTCRYESTLIKTSNKFEVIYGEVSGRLGPLGIPTACCKTLPGQGKAHDNNARQHKPTSKR
ncbi:2094_t:CDS:10, partial [Diversispora eburnea]